MKRTAPAAERNRDPILDVLRQVLPPRGLVLEVASGTGEHAVHFATALPDLLFQPTDPEPSAVQSIEAWRVESGAPNLRKPLFLDASSGTWPIERADAILCVNMVHISPWGATEGLMGGAGRLLPAGGPLILYGPYRRADIHTAPSNESFDASLKARNPEWGLRDLEAVAAEAEKNGLAFDRLFEMPANNLSLVFRKR